MIEHLLDMFRKRKDRIDPKVIKNYLYQDITITDKELDSVNFSEFGIHWTTLLLKSRNLPTRIIDKALVECHRGKITCESVLEFLKMGQNPSMKVLRRWMNKKELRKLPDTIVEWIANTEYYGKFSLPEDMCDYLLWDCKRLDLIRSLKDIPERVLLGMLTDKEFYDWIITDTYRSWSYLGDETLRKIINYHSRNKSRLELEINSLLDQGTNFEQLPLDIIPKSVIEKCLRHVNYPLLNLKVIDELESIGINMTTSKEKLKIAQDLEGIKFSDDGLKVIGWIPLVQLNHKTSNWVLSNRRLEDWIFQKGFLDICSSDYTFGNIRSHAMSYVTMFKTIPSEDWNNDDDEYSLEVEISPSDVRIDRTLYKYWKSFRSGYIRVIPLRLVKNGKIKRGI